jgi:predicted nucleic acid-binding protein
MNWLIDTDILIEGERENPAFEAWSSSSGKFATADIIRAEFLLGVHWVSDAALRVRGEKFYRDRILSIASFASESADYEIAARLAGEARRSGKGKPRVWPMDCSRPSRSARAQPWPREMSATSKPWAARAPIRWNGQENEFRKRVKKNSSNKIAKASRNGRLFCFWKYISN